MKIDSFIHLLLKIIRRQTLETDLNLKKEINFIKLNKKINPNAKKTYILVSGWYEKDWPSKKLRKRIISQGDSYFHYTFSSKILSARYKQTKEYIEEIKKRVINDINKIKNKKILLGISLGGIPSIMIANNTKVDEVVFIAPSDSLAQALWEGLRTQKIRKSLEKQKITLKKLKELWKNLEPINNLNNLKNTKIIIFNSKSDLIIPYKRSLGLIEKMKEKGIKPLVFTNKNLGHYLTALKFYNSKNSLKLIS